MDEASARRVAALSSQLRDGMSLGTGRELNEGWFFPFLTDGVVGSNGLIVNKRSGRLFHLGSVYPVDRDLELYDRGYQFDKYDLAVVAVRDRAQTLTALGELRLTFVEPSEEHGVVWKIPRPVTRDEIAGRLERLPCVWSAVKLYFVAEVLENARRGGWFSFELREHVPSTT